MCNHLIVACSNYLQWLHHHLAFLCSIPTRSIFRSANYGIKSIALHVGSQSPGFSVWHDWNNSTPMMNILIETGREQGFRSLESVSTSLLCQSPNKPHYSYRRVFTQPCPARSPSPPFRAPPLFFAPTQTLNLQDNPIWPSSCQDWSQAGCSSLPPRGCQAVHGETDTGHPLCFPTLSLPVFFNHSVLSLSVFKSLTHTYSHPLPPFHASVPRGALGL